MYRRDQERTGNRQRTGTASLESDSTSESFQTILQSAITGAMSTIMAASRRMSTANDQAGNRTCLGDTPGPSGLGRSPQLQYRDSSHEASPRLLPTSFVPKRRRVDTISPKQSRNIVYDRDIVCLPNSMLVDGRVTIPRYREELASNGLIGKIRLYSSMTESEIFDEIRSVFRGPMSDKVDFRFTILQSAGGGSKSLIVPALSPTYQYTASAAVGKNSKMPIYILALDDLKWKDPIEEEEQTGETATHTSNTVNCNSQSTYHRPYIDLVTGNESDPDSANSSSPTSPISVSSSESTQDNRSLEAVLTEYRQRVISTTMVHRLHIRRHHIYSDSLKAFKKKFPFNATIKVVFLGEPAIDIGGPLREYLALLMKEIVANNSLFNGPDDCRGIVHSMRSIESKAFYYIGQMMAVSIIHGGPGPGCLSHAVVDYITYGLNKVNATIDDIADPKVQEQLKCIESSEDNATLQAALQDMEPELCQSGNVHLLSSSMEDKSNIIREIAKYFSVVHVKAELDDLQNGLGELGVLNLLRQNTITMRALFVATHDVLTADIVQDLFKPFYSPTGSNRREHEEEVIMFWISFLQEIEDSGGVIEVGDDKFRINFESILGFATGAQGIPPVGFWPVPQIQFQLDSPFPTANTCANCLNLPCCSTYDDFKEKMVMAIIDGVGFGQA